MVFEERLSSQVLKAIEQVGYTQPTPFQDMAIPIISEGHDLVGVAPSGSGKAAAYLLPMISRLATERASDPNPTALILCANRTQVARLTNRIEKYGEASGLTAIQISDAPFGYETTLLHEGFDVLVATPERLLKHIQCGNLQLKNVQIAVLNMADELHVMPDVQQILGLVPETGQRLLFAETLPSTLTNYANIVLNTPKFVDLVGPAEVEEKSAGTSDADTEIHRASLLTNVTHCVYPIGSSTAENRQRISALVLLLWIDKPSLSNVLVFCNREQSVASLNRDLVTRARINVAKLTSSMNRTERSNNLELFLSGASKILIVHDEALAGIELPPTKYVINFNVPVSPDVYIDRARRITTIANKTGHVFSICAEGEGRFLENIQDRLGVAMREVPDLDNLPIRRKLIILNNLSGNERYPYPASNPDSSHPQGGAGDSDRFTSGALAAAAIFCAPFACRDPRKADGTQGQRPRLSACEGDISHRERP